MKISVSSYSFERLLNNNTMTQLDCVKKAKELGFDAIEFVDIRPQGDMSKQEYAKLLRAECEKCGLEISNYTFGADLINGSNGDIKAEIAMVKGQIDIAEILGAKSVRHDATGGFEQNVRGYRGFDDALKIIVPAIRGITEYAKAKGIKTMVENHGFFAQDSARVEKLINEVANENFGWLCDMGNFLCAGENPVDAVGRAAPYAFYVHAKDFHVKSGMLPNPGDGYFMSRTGDYLRGAIIGHGDVPVKQCIAAVKRVGFDGYIAIEFEGLEDNILALTIGIANLKRFIAEA